MNRYAVLYLVTLFVLVPLDFLFLGIVAKDFFTSQVGNMLGEIKLVPAVLFYLLYVVGIVIFVSGAADATWQIDAALWRAVRLVLLRDLRSHVAVAAAALELAGRDRRHFLGRGRDGGLIDRRPSCCELAGAENLIRHSGRCEASNPESRDPGYGFGLRDDAHRCHFGCGTIRMYGFGDFQPCG